MGGAGGSLKSGEFGQDAGPYLHPGFCILNRCGIQLHIMCYNSIWCGIQLPLQCTITSSVVLNNEDAASSLHSILIFPAIT